MAYKLYTEISFAPSGNPKDEVKQVKCYPTNAIVYQTKKTKVIELPKGLQFNHAEDLAKELASKKFFTTCAIEKTIDPR